MQVYNSITKQKEKFVTLEPNNVKMYVCGPTVYDNLHIGNARPLVVFDTIRRFLEYIGYTVTHVQNFTDIDDKIISRANENGVTTEDLTKKYIEEALIDMNGLNLLPYANSPKVTEEMTEIIEMIKILVKKGNAYISDGNVYFYTPSFLDYGLLKNVKQKNMQSRLEEDHLKKHPSDFTLWKTKKQDETHFDSPWSEGRPGWHIECSAIIKKYLGDTIDIHGGGYDLLFPHHENEIAQSVCANDAPLARYFIHNGFINIDSEKMSKSSGNFFIIRDLAEQYGYNTLRFFLLSSHYRSAINYSKESIESSKAGLERIKKCLENFDFLLKNNLLEKISNIEKNTWYKKDFIKLFDDSMKDDFNTSNAISVIFDMVRFANQNINRSSSIEFITIIKTQLKNFLDILGVKIEHTKKNETKDKQIKYLIEKRQKAKDNKNFDLADHIREQVISMGVVLEDTQSGTRWKYLDE